MFVKIFENSSPQHSITSGGKGKSLALLRQSGFYIPNGFVVLSTAYEKFILENQLEKPIDTIIQQVVTDSISTAESASRQIQEMILSYKITKELELEILEHYSLCNLDLVAVRSSATSEDSATDAWAGQLESYLNISADTLIANVQQCWASLYTTRAIMYRLQKELHKSAISVAVVIQQMIQPDISGIAFSVNPITKDLQEIVIEAGYGLGEAIVSGKVTPDTYTVNKETHEITSTYISVQTKELVLDTDRSNKWRIVPIELQSKQKLSASQILHLSKTIIDIETFYNAPQDIEWALKDEIFYITQSRPITTL